jgi:hypothetical protein
MSSSLQQKNKELTLSIVSHFHSTKKVKSQEEDENVSLAFTLISKLNN